MNWLALRDLELESLRAWVERRMGLVFHPHQMQTLIEAAQETCKRFGYTDTHRLHEALSRLPDGSPEFDYLIARITVGESFFFRDAVQMDFLRREFLPSVIGRRRRCGHRRLRVWSAAAAAGQELYSVAMLLRELLPDVDEWNLHLLGTDINAQSLQGAVEGHYSEWSMRAVEPGQRERHFLPDPGLAGGARVRPELQRMTRFSILNLAADGFPSMTTNVHGFDLILCRNVFIYFDQQRVHSILARIVKCLAPNGVLMLGASDVVAVDIEGLETLQREGMCYYRLIDRTGATEPMPLADLPLPARSRAAASRVEAAAPPSEPSLSSRIAHLAENARWQELASVAERAALLGLRDDAPSCRHIATAFGNLGLNEQALDWCGRALQLDPMSSQAQHLHALLHVEAGDDMAALEAFRRTLFLAPESVEAHHQLALLQLRVGNRDKGLRSLRNALRLAQRLVLEARGEARTNAARMVEIIENELVIHDQEESRG